MLAVFVATVELVVPAVFTSEIEVMVGAFVNPASLAVNTSLLSVSRVTSKLWPISVSFRALMAAFPTAVTS